MRTILRRVQVDWGFRKTGELLDLAKVLYHWTKRDFPPLLTYIIFNNMIAIIFRTFTRDKQSFSPSGGWTKRSPPRGNNPCQLGDVRWQRHLLDLPMASYFCQVALIMLMMVVVRILMIVMKTFLPQPTWHLSMAGQALRDRVRPGKTKNPSPSHVWERPWKVSSP